MATHVNHFGDLPARLNALKILLAGEMLTPLLRKEINHAADLHAAAIEQPDLDDLDTRAQLATLYQDLTTHWAQLYGNMTQRVYLVNTIASFQRILLSKLIEDYSRVPNQLSPILFAFVLERFGFMENHDSGTRNDGIDYYDELVVLPLKEMMLDHRHVQTIIRAIATSGTESEHRPGQVEHLVHQRNWEELARTIINDRQLVLDFFTHNKPMGTMFDWGVGISAEILNGLDVVQNTYFAELSSPSAFTLTSYATDPSSQGTSALDDAPPHTGPAQESWASLARGVCQNISNRLRGGGS